MEAPVEIYLTTDGDNSFVFTQKRSDNKGIEYVRTDYAEKVFLRTVNAWLAEIHRVCDITDENGYRIGLEKLQASFKKYMEK